VPLILALEFSVAACSACAQSTDYWQLVDSKGDQLPKDYAMVELNAKSDNELSDVPAYVDLILAYLGCPAAAQPGSSGESHPNQASPLATPRPCKFRKLYIDAVADGSPKGRAFAQALTESLTKSRRIELTGNPKEADALFICGDELAAYRRKEADEAKRQEAKEVDVRLAAAAGSGKPNRYISYVVESDCEDAGVDVTYGAGSGQTEQRTEQAPWLTVIPYSSDAFYYLAAQKHDGSICEVNAEMYSVNLTHGQLEILISAGSDEAVSYVAQHGHDLREASSDTGYGIASVSWSARD